MAKRGTPTTYISKTAGAFNKRAETISLEDYLQNIMGVLKNLLPNTPIHDYMYQIVEKCISLNGVFYKNDINDALILETLAADSVILTFDTGIQKHLARYQNNHPEYTASLNEIAALKSYVLRN